MIKDSPTPVLLFEKESNHSTLELLTIPEAARLLRISVSGVRRLQQGRHIPFIKIGNCVRFAETDLAAYLQRRRVESIE